MLFLKCGDLVVDTKGEARHDAYNFYAATLSQLLSATGGGGDGLILIGTMACDVQETSLSLYGKDLFQQLCSHTCHVRHCRILCVVSSMQMRKKKIVQSHLQGRPWSMPARACTAEQICCGISLGMSSTGRNVDRSVLKMYSCADKRKTLYTGLCPVVACRLSHCRVCQSQKHATASLNIRAEMSVHLLLPGETCCRQCLDPDQMLLAISQLQHAQT